MRTPLSIAGDAAAVNTAIIVLYIVQSCIMLLRSFVSILVLSEWMIYESLIS